MKPEQDDKWLEEMIQRAVGSEDAQFDAVSWKKRFPQEVESLESRNKHTAAARHRSWQTWRSIMSKRSSKIAALAAVAAGIIAAVTISVTGGGSTVAMAAVLEQLQTKCYEFEMSAQTEDGATQLGKGTVLEPGRMRLEQRGGLGPVSIIVDNDAGQSLVLFDRSKAAYRFDGKQAKEIEVFDFLVLPMQSIENLWSLKAPEETALGKKDIDGTPAEGFQVIQKNEEYTQTISVWADAKTGYPLKVELVLEPSEEGKAELTLSDFRVIPEPSAALFSTEVPEGYTLADSQTLDQLTTESDTSDSTTADTSPQAQIVVAALVFAARDNKKDAVELMMAVDWSDDLRFSQEHHLFTMTEQQFMSLVTADREKVSTATMTQLSQCRTILRELLELGRKARAAGNGAQAEKYFTTSVRFGRLLDHNTDMLIIVRMVGKVIQQSALTELSSLYEEQGETEKLQDTRAQISRIEEQLEEIKAGLQGVPGR